MLKDKFNLKKKAWSRLLLPSFPHVRSQITNTNSEAQRDPHQTQNLLTPWSGIFSLQTCKLLLINYTVFCHSSLKLRHHHNSKNINIGLTMWQGLFWYVPEYKITTITKIHMCVCVAGVFLVLSFELRMHRYSTTLVILLAHIFFFYFFFFNYCHGLVRTAHSYNASYSGGRD
jgi:hypothetical protein